MNGLLKTPVPTLAAMAATAAFLVSGGIWLGNLQTRLDEHTGLLAHIDADKRLDEIEAEMSALSIQIASTDNLLHKLTRDQRDRHKELMDNLRLLQWQPYVKEE